MRIHETAIISKKAKLADNVSVGAYTVINDGVVVGEGTKIGNHCLLEGNTNIGKNCEIFTGAVIGSRPQDLKYKGVKVFLEIGGNNIIREYSTFNPGTEKGNKTVVGSGNLFMAYSHIAHDCRVGNNCVFANNATLAGHVTIEDMAVIGGLVAIHQFVRVGSLSIIGGCSKVVQDIPPYSTCDGHPAVVYGLNLVGLRRHKVPRDTIKELGRAYKIIFNSGFTATHALEKLENEQIKSPEVKYLINFIKGSQRGLSKSCRVEK
ncbi:MAG: acyl-[acyl-carrier-protein]--UDP-N-acetylglucosamine O-acyltransferase [Candidatus Omnitrophica bacterium CG08_land_8_20_14_0_20_41_16]|uniref:Acyl-[acyl-carrier-protein]--UDP-N-acetylglucosamine O-acyltransferase n=1 Tax=Candidatus Sherwoodlollariibacterium unditelluris TaxID=1974757 RepID=A0A2G9YKC0_9BACT|nr:MAG: acyl-[acyl-carrier-protein]--UDP-N-acetylglucosamine O-acyltransferase [Candidatus Omnitrophica bacterium CG23_combo_of_CG06-09_8_20_14_all_41_10]PIS33780.1 MAG: acyl-[acyl-carrier-protein]--UDP-N-acetylglucosamine O-acyltransferase [Candidatus Omnitrophica bacterium CG08_land_8_20_14_0_20_41_16]